MAPERYRYQSNFLLYPRKLQILPPPSDGRRQSAPSIMQKIGGCPVDFMNPNKTYSVDKLNRELGFMSVPQPADRLITSSPIAPRQMKIMESISSQLNERDDLNHTFPRLFFILHSFLRLVTLPTTVDEIKVHRRISTKNQNRWKNCANEFGRSSKVKMPLNERRSKN